MQGPQGSGKTATKKGLDQQYSAQSDVGIIQVTLSSLDLRDLTWSIVSNAKEQNLIDDTFLTEVGYEEGKDLEKPKLEKIIVSVLKKAVSKKEFGILIIDEFDIIVKGKGGHAAIPNLTVDPIVIASQADLSGMTLSPPSMGKGSSAL